MTTVLKRLGVDYPYGTAGRDVLEIKDDKTAFSEMSLCGTHQAAVIDGTYKLIFNLSENEMIGLYDVEADPSEARNLSTTESSRAEALERELLSWLELRSGESVRSSSKDSIDPVMTRERMIALRALGYTQQ